MHVCVKDDSCEVFIMTEIRSGTKKNPQRWNVKEVQRVLGLSVCNNNVVRPFHPRCDTIIGHSAQERTCSSAHSSYNHFINHAAIFVEVNAILADTPKAGKAAILCKYTGTAGDTL